MPEVPLVVVGASAGGVEALRALVAGLPADLDAAVLVVLHIPRTGPSALPRILARAGRLPAAPAEDGVAPEAGHIYVAPSDHHLLVVDGELKLSRGPAENGHRPAVDPLFRSAARASGRNTVAVVLSGSRDDGTAGAASVLAHGGRVLVQDPDDALHPSMPRSVLEHARVDVVCPAVELGPAVAAAVAALNGGKPADPADDPDPDLAELETAMASMDDMNIEDLPSSPAGLACPSCNGALFELPGEPSPRYRCWVGHAWSPESLLDEQGAAFEAALWMALRSLEEKASLVRRMANAAGRRGNAGAAERFRDLGDETANAAQLIRKLIDRVGAVGTADTATEN